MKKIKRNIDFDRSLFENKEPYYVTCDKFWDGGFKPDASLEEKCEFYSVAGRFSNFIKRLTIELDDKILIGSRFSEKGCVFENWKNLREFDSFNNLSGLIGKRYSYELSLPEDGNIVDCIVENNFRYLSCIDLYLPKSRAVLQPTCHTEVFLYAKNYDSLITAAEEVLRELPDLSLRKYDKT